MKLVFISNYFNHHQKALSETFNNKLNEKYLFIATTLMREERKKLGYDEKDNPGYVLQTYLTKQNQKLVKQELINADVIIAGSAPEDLLQQCIRKNKLVFRYSERPLKKGREPLKYIPRFFRWHWRNPFWKPIYMLCASAYTAGDYAMFGLFRNNTYKWGYFPEMKLYEDIDSLFRQKKKNNILWCGRFLDWKHPDDALRVALCLKNNGLQFTLNIIGSGNMERQLKQMIIDYHLEDYVHVLGSMSPGEVRKYMEQSSIFLFTSDKQEGWGAVLNESMNSGCAVVASHAIGSVPFLLKNDKNGLVYKSGDIDMLYEKVKYLLEHPEEQKKLGIAAYHTIVGEWNAEVAAERFINLAEHILAGEKNPDLYKTGPCSKAEIIQDDWM